MMLFHFIIFILTNEAVMWAFTINRHADWMGSNAELIKCRSEITGVTYSVIRYAAVMTGIVILTLGLFWVMVSASDKSLSVMGIASCQLLLGISVIFSQLAFIHLFAIVARCSGLPTVYWPLLSKHISFLLSKTFRKGEGNE